ncbi:MAG TPA: hypothetical protein VL984_11830 [Acidimicrobiales bacterium]|nr:hypothetical protein [Acidimicrobiales bacterium]
MPDKLEVIPGPGLVARFGEVAVWAGPQATAALQAHLVSEAQRLAHDPSGGDQLASSLITILQRGDPEPQAPFAVLGPGPNGLTLFLHGPVQAWDSGRWLYPQPVPGWMVTPIGRPWPLIILPYGAPPPPQSQQGNPLDLQAGAVPGAGFVVLRPPTGPSPAVQPPGGTPFQVPQGGGQTYGPPGAGSPGPVVGPGPAAGATPGPGGIPGPGGMGGGGQGWQGGASASTAPTASTTSVAQTASTSPPASSASAAPVTSAPAIIPGGAGGTGAATADLRSVGLRTSFPLPSAAGWTGPLRPGADVLGTPCPRGHLNHPRSQKCGRCGRAILAGTPQQSGPRPPLGLLLADDGSIYSLSTSCIIGSDPAVAPEAQSGSAQPIAMRAGPNHTMAAVHAEIQARGWSAYLIDRGAESGSCMQGPSAEGWSQLSRNEQRELPNGSHVSCGGRVLTFLSAWPS